MSKARFVAGLIVGLLVACHSSARADVVNGGFETGDLTGWMFTGNVEAIRALVDVGPDGIPGTGDDVPVLTPPEGNFFALLSTGPGFTFGSIADLDGNGIMENDIATLSTSFTVTQSSLLNFSLTMVTDEIVTGLPDIFTVSLEGPSPFFFSASVPYDDDRDGRFGEDPTDGIDNDGDGRIDEDDATLIDDDGDTFYDEDPVNGVDDDLDGLIDEDAVNPVPIPFTPIPGTGAGTAAFSPGPGATLNSFFEHQNLFAVVPPALSLMPGAYALTFGVGDVRDDLGDSGLLVDRVQVTVIPEPSTGLLVGYGLAVIFVLQRRSYSRK